VSERAALASVWRGRLVWGVAIALGLIAYRRALLWDPGAPGLPDLTWFFFGLRDTTPQLVVVVSAALLLARRRRILTAARGPGAPALAAPFLVSALGLFCWGHHAGAEDLVLASLLPGGIGAALLVGGRPLARVVALPVLFLTFALPLPGVVVNQVVFPVQLLTAEEASWLLRLLGSPVVREGDVLHLAHRSFEVIETCSGLRAIAVMSMLAVAWVSLLPVRRGHGLALVLLAPLVAHLLNSVRVTVLALDPQSDPARGHSIQGVVVFVSGAVILCAADALLRRLWPPDGPRSVLPDPRMPEPHVEWRGNGKGLVLVVGLGVLVVASLVVPRWAPSREPARNVEPPDAIGSWRLAGELEVDRAFLGQVLHRNSFFGRYVQDGRSATVYVGFDDRSRRDRSLLSPKNALPGRSFRTEERWTVPVQRGEVEAVLASSGVARVLTWTWYEGSRGPWAEAVRALLALDQSVLRRPGGVRVHRVATELEPGDSVEVAEGRLRDLAERLFPPPETNFPSSSGARGVRVSDM
jgi:exosortase